MFPKSRFSKMYFRHARFPEMERFPEVISSKPQYFGIFFVYYFAQFPRGPWVPLWYAVGTIFAARQSARGVPDGTAPAFTPARWEPLRFPMFFEGSGWMRGARVCALEQPPLPTTGRRGSGSGRPHDPLKSCPGVVDLLKIPLSFKGLHYTIMV